MEKKKENFSLSEENKRGKKIYEQKQVNVLIC